MQTILKIQVRNTTYVIAGIARYRWAFLSFTFTSTNIDWVPGRRVGRAFGGDLTDALTGAGDLPLGSLASAVHPGPAAQRLPGRAALGGCRLRGSSPSTWLGLWGAHLRAAGRLARCLRRTRLARPWAGSRARAARARPRLGASPPRRGAERRGREAVAPEHRVRPNGDASARGSPGRRLGRPGRAVPELHVRGAELRQRLPVGRVVPQEPGKGRPPRPAVGTSAGPRRRLSAAALPPTLWRRAAQVGRADSTFAHFALTVPRLGARGCPPPHTPVSSPGHQSLGVGRTGLRFWPVRGHSWDSWSRTIPPLQPWTSLFSRKRGWISTYIPPRVILQLKKKMWHPVLESGNS